MTVIQVTKELSYEEQPVTILNRQVRKLRIKEAASVKIFRCNNNREGDDLWSRRANEEEVPSVISHIFKLLFPLSVTYGM